MSPEHLQRPRIIGIGGLTSNVGKTTLVCDLLQFLPGWEAIKTTRGHYRSCGKDPHTCCVSDLLDTEPVIRSGREFTYTAGKDSARYWDAGAANVHWVIATDEQVAAGVRAAVSRVKADGVLIEGNSFTEHLETDAFIMVARPDDLRMKSTARKALSKASAVYFSSEVETGRIEGIEARLGRISAALGNDRLPFFTPRSRDDLIAYLKAVTAAGRGRNFRQT